MKKFLIVTNLLLLGIAGYEFYKIQKLKGVTGIDTVVAPNPFVDSLDGLIEGNLAVVMSRNFRDDHAKSHMAVGGTEIEDTRSVLFSFETLQKFLAEIEQQLPPNNDRPPLGIRVYFAKYPQNLQEYASLRNVDTSVAGRQVVFMVPTYYAGPIKQHVDFNIYNIGTDKTRPIPYSQSLNVSTDKSGILGNLNKRTFNYDNNAKKWLAIDGIENHGGLSPPPDGEGTFPTGQ